MKTTLTLVLILLGQLLLGQTNEISQISDDLYRYRHNGHYNVFLVTPEGIIITDPISEDAANWLKQELSSRFEVPVTHMIYSHDHADHISGGEVFGDEVTVIAHRLTKEAIVREQRNVPLPEVVFDDQYVLELGEARVELYYPGRSHNDNCIAVLFPAQSTVFVVDFITVDRLPYRDLGGGYMPDWIEAIQYVEDLDFEILAPGHGVIGTKADATEHREYFEALRDAVSKAIDQGQSLEEMQQTISLDQFKHFGNYDEWLALNIEGMYNMISDL